MGKFVGVCIALLVFAAGYVGVTAERQMTALLEAFRLLSWPSEIAWTVLVLAPLALVVAAIWLWYTWAQQQQTATALALRLDGVRGEVKGLVKSQVDAETAVHQLARSDPEDALASIQQRLGEAERFAQVQHGRNEAADLESRVAFIRAQQQALKDRLTPVLERRRGIEQLFIELDSRQNDLDRTLDEISTGDDAAAIDVGLKKLMEFVGRSHGRCDDVERSAKIMVGLKEDFADLRKRLSPHAAPEDGIAARLKELRETRERLALDIDALLDTPQGSLADRVQKLADEKKSIERRLSEMNEEFAKLATLRGDFAGLLGGFNRALDFLAVETRGEGSAAVDARTEELASFINATQAQLHDIERRLVTFQALKMKLHEVQKQLVPLEAGDGGLANVIEGITNIRDQIAARVKRMEESDDGNLADRVKKFTETRRELEERVAVLNDQFVKLAGIREDIGSLFEKLSSAVKASAR